MGPAPSTVKKKPEKSNKQMGSTPLRRSKRGKNHVDVHASKVKSTEKSGDISIEIAEEGSRDSNGGSKKQKRYDAVEFKDRKSPSFQKQMGPTTRSAVKKKPEKSEKIGSTPWRRSESGKNPVDVVRNGLNGIGNSFVNVVKGTKTANVVEDMTDIVLDESCYNTKELGVSLIARMNEKHFKTLSLDESRSPDFDLFSDQEEYSEEDVAETMVETMEQYMSKTRADYGSGVARPKIEDKDNFELKGQFLKELRTNTFSGSDHEDVNEHIEKVLKIVDLFHIPNITIDQVMLRAFPMSLTGAASHLARTIPSVPITN
ncbi:hypothetical protein Tco_0511572 [Tanacetum coccineum]